MYNNEMEILPNIKQGRNSFACQYRFEDRYVYAIGGASCFVGKNDVILSSVERFDILNQKWKNLSDLNESRMNPGTFIADEKLYAF